MTILANKTILITGSSRGIGAATAKLAVKKGAKVILHGKTESKALIDLSKELNMPYIYCPIEDGEMVNLQVKEILEKYKVDVLINNAGIMRAIEFEDLIDENWLEEYRINLLGTVHFCQSLLPYFLNRKKGLIINTASIRGLPEHAGIYNMSYSASKAAIINFTSALAKKYEDLKILAFAPTFTLTDIAKSWPSDQKGSFKKIAMKPEKVAEEILSLVENPNSYPNGSTIISNGNN